MAKLNLELVAVRETWRKAKAEKEALVKLREKKVKEYHKQRQTEEDSERDDLFSRRFSQRKANSVVRLTGVSESVSCFP
jgi:flagellar biosynthesis chaperone FliJ